MNENSSLSLATGGLLRPGGLNLTERMLMLCELSPGDIVIDVGCGTGSTIRYLLDVLSVYAVGVDLSEVLLQEGTCIDPRLPLVCASGKYLPVMDMEMKAVLAECSFSTMSDPKIILAEFRRVLEPSGLLALTDIYARDTDGIPTLRALPLCCGLRAAMGKEELVATLQAHGFEIVTWEDHSEALKHLAAQLILSHGSMNEFWSHSEPSADPIEIQTAINKAKLGYYLLVAKKI
jgi:ubiquinone/menaquinone biosynthesis C-methylase UbiE